MVPIFIKNKVWGIIGFDDCIGRRRWEPNEKAILTTAAISIGGAIERYLQEKKLLKALGENKELAARLTVLIANMKDGVLALDGTRNIILINDAFCEMFGLPPNSDAFLGASGNSLFTNIQSNFQETTEFLKRIRGYYTSIKMELNKEVLIQDGRICELDYIPIDVDGTFSGHLWHYRDITIRKQNEQKLIETNKILQGLSSVDGLTGIANRRTFDERLQAEWTRGIRNSSNNKPLSLIMFDIDHFKLYNDTYGHLQGDLCLKQIAEALKKST